MVEDRRKCLCVAANREKPLSRVYPLARASQTRSSLQQVKPQVPALTKALSHANNQSHINALATGKRPYLIRKSLPPRIRKAIDAFVFDGLSRPEAAASAGISDNWLYKKLKEPEVLKYYRVQCEVLRSGQRHRNLHMAVKLRDTSESDKARIEAMKFLENDYSGENGSNRPVNVNVTVTPGYICDVSKVSDRSKQILQLGGRVIEHEPDQ